MQFYKELYGNKELVTTDPKYERFKAICETHLDQITDVFIQMLTLIVS